MIDPKDVKEWAGVVALAWTAFDKFRNWRRARVPPKGAREIEVLLSSCVGNECVDVPNSEAAAAEWLVAHDRAIYFCRDPIKLAPKNKSRIAAQLARDDKDCDT